MYRRSLALPSVLFSEELLFQSTLNQFHLVTLLWHLLLRVESLFVCFVGLLYLLWFLGGALAHVIALIRLCQVYILRVQNVLALRTCASFVSDQ